MGMAMMGETNKPDISDILATIQQMAAEKKARLNGQKPKTINTQPTDPRDTAASQQDITPFQSIHDLEDDEDFYAFSGSDLEPTPEVQSLIAPDAVQKQNTTRPMQSMLDRHFNRLAENTEKAWPGFTSQRTEQTDQSVQCQGGNFCLGPILESQVSSRSLIRDPKKNIAQPAYVPNGFQGLPDLSLGHSTSPRHMSLSPDSPHSQPHRSTVQKKAVHTNAPETFNEASAHLIRPLILQWVNDNLPRLVEGALTSENTPA